MHYDIWTSNLQRLWTIELNHIWWPVIIEDGAAFMMGNIDYGFQMKKIQYNFSVYNIDYSFSKE